MIIFLPHELSASSLDFLTTRHPAFSVTTQMGVCTRPDRSGVCSRGPPSAWGPSRPPALPHLQSIRIICSLCQLLRNVSSQTATQQKARSCVLPTTHRPVCEPRTLSCSSPTPLPRVFIFWASAPQPSGAQTHPALRGSPVSPAFKSLPPPP